MRSGGGFVTLPGRWQPVRGFFEVVQAPLVELATGRFVVEANGPDGVEWNDLNPTFIDLAGPDPATDAARAVAIACGARAGLGDPAPEGQRRRALYYAPASFSRDRRKDRCTLALAAIVLDIDEKDHGSRAACNAALSRLPDPTYRVNSGRGIQAGYVLREALTFDRGDAVALEDAARRYLSVALSLQQIAGADPTHWPSHLFRCPGAYHLKDSNRPVLVTVELAAERRFNLADFDDYTVAVQEAHLDQQTSNLAGKLLGRTHSCARSAGSVEQLHGRIRLPRRVSSAVVELLNTGTHAKYTRTDGSLDRSRALYAAAISLLAAGLSQGRTAQLLCASALRPAMHDRGDYGPAWVENQVRKAAAYLACQGAEGRHART